MIIHVHCWRANVQGYNVAVTLSLKGVTSYFNIKKPTIQEYESAELSDKSYDLLYDSSERKLHSTSSHNQKLVAEERMNAKERGLMSMTAKDILGVFNDRGHSALRSQKPSLYDAAHTWYHFCSTFVDTHSNL